jgi:hypothetical protein
MWKGALAPCRGKSWLQVPFYLAESYLYFRILLSIGYFDTDSSYYRRDPYRSFKDHELNSANGGIAIGRRLVGCLQSMDQPHERLRAILYNSLWGNRVDLSLFHIAEKSRDRVLDEGGDNLLIDHSEPLVRLIDGGERIDFILDNTGQELVSDLIAVWHILSHSPPTRVYLHAKRYPFYVSDAMVVDVEETIAAMARDGDNAMSSIGLRLDSLLDEGRIVLDSHYFWNGPLHYPDLPKDLGSELSRSHVVLLKGDINYRRIVSDRRWRVSNNLEEIASYFPTSFALIRTMKSEAVVDIEDERAAKLDAEDPEWRVNGERGMIRLVKKGR